jgi:hypothetical protein
MVSISSLVLSRIALLVVHVLSGGLDSLELSESVQGSHEALECHQVNKQDEAHKYGAFHGSVV